MTTPVAPPIPAAAPAAGSLRIVLFGLAGAGKSSLLGALAEAAQAQEHLLHGRLNDLSHGLSVLQGQLYDAAPQRTAEEIVPYPIAFEPFDDADGGPLSAVLVDSDGQVAHELVQHTDALDNGQPAGKLAGEVLGADALVLAVDCSASHEQLEEEFGAFERFLRDLEQGRSARVDIGGLPVFLVLTKCDLLAQLGDTTVDWMERIEQRKREVDAHFRSFLARRASETGSVPFGQLDLHLWATAVGRPALSGAPARPREPYGVAELFWQSLEGAAAYRRRCRQASQRLFWTAWASGVVVGAFMILALFLVLWPGPKPPSEEQLAAEALQFGDQPTPAERLSGPLTGLRLRREKFRAVVNDRGFDVLPHNLHEFVVSRHNELDKYIEWLDDLNDVRRPVTVDTEAGLRDIKAKLEKLGSRSREEWDGTEALRQYHERLEEVNALLDGVERVQAAYLGDAKKAQKLWAFDGYRTDNGGVNWRLWSADLETLRGQFQPTTFKQTDKIPGSTTLTYAAVMRFDTVIDASTLRQRLERERNLAAAFGLIAPVPNLPALLVIDRPPLFKLSMAKARWQDLQMAYPEYKTEFVRGGLPDVLLREVDRAAVTNYEFLLEPARERVLSQLQKSGDGAEETPARWQAVRDWLLGNPDELTEWRSLAVLLAHLHDPKAPDPVTALAAFLQETTFSLEVQRITLELPDSARIKAPVSAALSIYHPRTGGQEPELLFEQTTEPKRDPDRQVTIYQFELKKGKRMVYLPGDELWATLPLRDGMQLTWARNHSMQYQFECLLRPPRLHKASEPNTNGDLVDDVRVTVAPAEGWPRVPDLLPVVRLTK